MNMNQLKFNIFLLIFLFLSVDAWSKSARYRCMWRTDPSHSIVIGWDQVSGSDPVVYYDMVDYGEDASMYKYVHEPDRVVDTKNMSNHFARLEGLQANTVYYFVIKDSEAVSKRMSFKTISDNPNDRLAIIAGGDSRNHRDARISANKIVGKLRPHFVMFGGDMTARDVGREWINWFNDWQHTISANGRITPIIVTRGNHEYANKTLNDLFDVRDRGLYYALTFGGDLLRVYTLNSLIASGGEQKKWLQNDLRENDQKILWKTAQYHFSTRPHTTVKAERNDQLLNWSTLFYKYNVNLIVESDVHTVKSTYPIRPSNGPGSDEGFIRDDEKGNVYIGEGCWGAPLRPANDTKKWTRASGSFNQFKWIFVDQDKIEVRTIKTGNGGAVEDSYEDNAFSAPAKLDIWQAENGAVITIDRPSSALYTASNGGLITRGDMKISQFRAALNDNDVVVTWTTEMEMSGATFDIQRSIDGKSFQTIASVTGSASTGSPQNYLVMDSGIGQNIKSTMSYRIKRHLPGGDTKIFAPCVVGRDLLNWKMYTNVSPDDAGQLKIKYTLRDKANISIRLLNAVNHREIQNIPYRGQRAGNYLKSIDMNNLPNGQYIVVVIADNEIINKYQVMKQI